MVIALGIVSIVLGVLGGITFGVIGAGLGLIAGIIAIVLGINEKKKAGEGAANSQAGFVCGIIGLVFSAIFFAGCGICGLTESGSYGTKGYTCYGCIGGSCMMSNDVTGAVNDLNDLLDGYDW